MGLNLNHQDSGEALLTCIKRSVLPIISFNDLKPIFAKISLTSDAIKVNKLTTLSGVPVNFSLSFHLEYKHQQDKY